MQCFTGGLALLVLAAVVRCSPQFPLPEPVYPAGRNFVFPSASSSSSSNSVQNPPGPALSRIVSSGANPGRSGTSSPGQNRQDFDGDFNRPETTGEDFGEGRPEGEDQNRPGNEAAWDSDLYFNGQTRPHVAETRPVGSAVGTPEIAGQFDQNRPFGEGRPANGNDFSRPDTLEQSRPASGNEFSRPDTLGQSRPTTNNEFNRPNTLFGINDQRRPNTPSVSSNDVNRPNLFDRPYPPFGGPIPFRPEFGRPPFGFPPHHPFHGKRPSDPFGYRPGVDCTKTGPAVPSQPGPSDRPIFTPNLRPGANPSTEKNDSSEEQSDEDVSGEESNETSEESAEAGPANSIPNRWDTGPEKASTATAPVKVTAPCNCAAGPEYNPVCGTDNQTYENPRRLECARVCNRSPGVQLAYHAACLDRPIVPSLSGWGRPQPPQTIAQSQAQAQSSARRVRW